jgi:hypothetical protein
METKHKGMGGAVLPWFEVLLKEWFSLSVEMQEKVRQYDFWCMIAEQQGGRGVPELARQLERELQTEARKFGWKD